MSWNDFSTFLLVSFTAYICILVMCYKKLYDNVLPCLDVPCYMLMSY
jgi:hypothetical protein